MHRPWPPWWILTLIAVLAVCAGFLCQLVLFGPEPTGWCMTPVAGPGPEARYEITKVQGPSAGAPSGFEAGDAAARAGFEVGDLVLRKDVDAFAAHPQANTPYRFDIERRGDHKVLTLVLAQKDWGYWLRIERTNTFMLFVSSILGLGLGALVIFTRPYNRTARWGALFLAQLGINLLLGGAGSNALQLESIPELAWAFRNLPTPLGATVLMGMSISLFAYLTLPVTASSLIEESPETRAKGKAGWASFWLPAPLVLLVALRLFWLPVYSRAGNSAIPAWIVGPTILIGIGYLVWAVILLVRHYGRISDANMRRRVRVVTAGFAVTTAAWAAGVAMALPLPSVQRFQEAYWRGQLQFLQHIMIGVAPVCTAYAILRHRMFDIRVMVRLGLQYAAARGVLLSLVPVILLLLVLDLFFHGDQPFIDIAVRRGWLYAAAALGAYRLHVRRQVWLDALDRRFYRERYDAQRILRSVVGDVRTATSFEQEASQVVSQLEASLHPAFAAILVREPGEEVYRVLAARPTAPPSIPAGSKLISLLRVLDKPVEIGQTETGWLKRQLPPGESNYVTRARLEWIFPISLVEGRTEALLALGPKRSEEPYSGEDQDLLEGITSSLALLLDRSAPRAAIPESFKECPECGTCHESGASTCPHEGAALTSQPFPRLLAHRYRLDRRLGRGGMGTVYEALDTGLERRVAVKLMRPELMANADAISRFKQEARAAASFSHPHVVTVYDFGVTERQQAYLTMELLRGRSLRQELRQTGRLLPERSAHILRGVCAAVDEAHRHGLLHRDLKPDNIFLVQADAQDVAKVLDFGLAKLILPVEDADTRLDTSPGLLLGTVGYMSPEQLRGERPSASWDLWALAVVAYEMLTGIHPCDSSSASECARAVREGQMTPVNARVPEAPVSWQQFFDRALAVRVESRAASALQFYSDFVQNIQVPAAVGDTGRETR